MQAATANRRRYPRAEVGVTGTLYLADRPAIGIACKIIDISVGGAFIHCTAPIQIGQEVLVEVHFEKTAQLTAKVVRDPARVMKDLRAPEKSIVRWARGSSTAGFGVEFIELSADKQDFLTKYVEFFSQQISKK